MAAKKRAVRKLDNRVLDPGGKVVAKTESLDSAKRVWVNAPYGHRLQTRRKGKWKDYDEGK